MYTLGEDVHWGSTLGPNTYPFYHFAPYYTSCHTPKDSPLIYNILRGNSLKWYQYFSHVIKLFMVVSQIFIQTIDLHCKSKTECYHNHHVAYTCSCFLWHWLVSVWTTVWMTCMPWQSNPTKSIRKKCALQLSSHSPPVCFWRMEAVSSA